MDGQAEVKRMMIEERLTKIEKILVMQNELNKELSERIKLLEGKD